ncbi:RNase adapter RapZ [Corynebacterium antarcticum]|uniref:RNase adapter RapZ n=1 Tax=Corynebacterium antarcticum TaxID=2800405 RepID=A0A9Q4CAW9_9CORY|nr:RNase adapter RapZ [Corynebacterium antarcticum]MCX7491078.1 RNase adapter RapZ [Corynebacterium antarcticum]MCX7537103.1 RNase adapter RapZ [Corynebacterium antarcticum]MCX7539739.1 RNase adapter RapZ [Corynebacterium antarcticum]
MTVHAREDSPERSTGHSIESDPVLVTGMSGAGLSSAARVLEDLGWYVSHNLPAELMVELVELCRRDDSPVEKLAMVTDVRSRSFHGGLQQVMDELRDKGINPTVLFMDARDDMLIRRFDTVRRTHPLQGSDTLSIGIERERKALAGIKERADVVINTSDLSVHDLRRAIESSFATIDNMRQHVTVQSFGFKNGAPSDADLVVDVRFLPNPYWEPELRPFRGVDKPVSDYVLAQPAAQEFIGNFVAMFSTMVGGYRREGKSFITVAVGCTGGHHRSVAVAAEIARKLDEIDGLDVSVNHRDICRG